MSKRAGAVIFAGFFMLFTAFAIRYSYGMLLPYMLEEFQISKTEAGGIYSAYFLAFTMAVPFIGLLSDRFNIRIIVSLAAFFVGVGTILMSFSTSVLDASLFFMLAGIGHSACWSPVAALTQRWVSTKRVGIALTFVDLGASCGIAIWSVVIPLIVMNYGWRTGWSSLGTSAFVLAGINYLLVRSNPAEASSIRHKMFDDHTRRPIKEIYVRLLHNVKFWLIGLSYLLIGFSILIPYTFISTYAIQALMLSYESATRLITVISITGAVGKLVLGFLSDIWRRIKVMMICGLLMTIGT